MEPKTTVARPRYPLHHRALGLCLRCITAGFRRLPGWLAYALADLLVPVLVAVALTTKQRGGRKKRGFYRNTAIVFRGTLPDRMQRRLLWRWARHMVHLGVDTARMTKLTRDNMEQRCDLKDLAKIQAAADRGKGVIGVTGHVGSYEYGAYTMALAGIQTTTIYRASPIPIVTDVINELRGRSGQQMVERAGAVRPILRCLQRGEAVAIVADVSSKESDVWAPFLGTMAATNNTAGQLHLKTGAPIVVGTTQRIGRGRFKLCVWDLIDDVDTGDRDRDLQTIAERINQGLTRAIVAYPEQWFWDCRRYRQRPPGEVRDAEDLPPQIDAGPGAELLQNLSNS